MVYCCGWPTILSWVRQDPLYGSLELEPVIQRLIDTPQFQRLHGLKQLGTSDFVYRSCTHTRFEHSIGGEGIRPFFVLCLSESLGFLQSDQRGF